MPEHFIQFRAAACGARLHCFALQMKMIAPDVGVHGFEGRADRIVRGLAPDPDIAVLVAGPHMPMDVLHQELTQSSDMPA